MTEIVLRVATETDDGPRMMARSQARGLMARAADCDRVTIDFAGVSEVSPSFADEIFRVWAHAHSGVAIEAVNFSPYVERMMRRAGWRA